MAEANIDVELNSKAYFRRLERLEADLNVLFETRQLRDMRRTVRAAFIVGLLLIVGSTVLRPVYWSWSTLYGSKKYHSLPADEEAPPSGEAAPVYDGVAFDASIRQLDPPDHSSQEHEPDQAPATEAGENSVGELKPVTSEVDGKTAAKDDDDDDGSTSSGEGRPGVEPDTPAEGRANSSGDNR